MTQSLFISKGKHATLRKVWAGLLMLSLNLTGGLGTLFLTTNVAYAATTLPFTESFAENDGNTVPGWTEVESNPADAKISNAGERASSITKEHAHIEATASISRTLETNGFNSIHLKYYWRGLSNNSLSDTLKVYWKPTAEASYILLVTHATNTIGWSSEVDWALPTTADNTSIDIKFVSAVNHNNDAFYIDDVSVSGTEIEVSEPADTIAPVVSITSPTEDSTTGPTGTVVYDAGDSTSVTCTLDGTEVSCDMSPYVFTLDDGEYTFVVVGSDDAGNEGIASVTWNVDATGPIVTITEAPDLNSTSSDATFVFETEMLALSLCSIDGGAAASCTDTTTYEDLSDGEHIFTVYGTDSYGNVGPTSSYTWTIDTEEEVPTPTEEEQCELDGGVWNGETCDEAPVPPTDICPNVDGDQETLPEGMMLSEGQCIAITETETPPTPAPAPTPPPSGGGSSNFDYWGCTDTTATNFNSLANKDDGSCTHPGEVLGAATTTGTTTPAGEPQGEVLGASTSTPELPLPAACIASPYLRDYMKLGMKNDVDQVKLLQTFLNENMNANLPVTGHFGPLTKAAVKKFQKAHSADILQPWIDAGYDMGGLKDGTGYVYKTTKRAINMIRCTEATIPMPDLSVIN